ncbi:hypothetical protein VTN00DRAFT_7192 [Thermoascus crustaceus]|uniref:uncharacterized protein n=1 Tax=Thermoascus crustaceus TaxID=5088 RepID=UPI003742C5CC
MIVDVEIFAFPSPLCLASFSGNQLEVRNQTPGSTFARRGPPGHLSNDVEIDINEMITQKTVPGEITNEKRKD